MKRFTLLILLFSIVFAQAQIGDNLNFNKTKRLMSLDAYKEALPILDSLKSFNLENNNIDFLIGKCYAHLVYDREKAIPFLETAVKNVSEDYKNSYKNKTAPPETYYYLAKSYLLNYQLDQAISTVDKCLKTCKDEDLKERCKYIKSNALNAKDLMLMPIKIKIELLNEKINSKQDDYTALINADESVMVFTSRREGGVGNLKNDEGKYYEDIYISYKKDGQWTEAKNMGKNINTERHDACVALSPDASTLILYRDDYGIGNLYISHKDSLGWSKAIKLSQNINSKSNETHASFSHDGQILYFVSDIKEGFGGKDIYFSKLLPDGTWGYPQNIGNHINTEYDEDGVFLHPDGQKLYFSSKGHNSMGAYDIFYCELIGDTVWSEPKNMGYPINTTDSDMFAVFSADNKRAYYSANKKDGTGAYDIYRMDLMSLPERNNTIVKGLVKDANGNVLKNKLLKVSDKNGNVIGKYKSDKQGLYTLVLQQGQTYQLKISGLQLQQESLEIPDNSSFFITQKTLEVGTITQIK